MMQYTCPALVDDIVFTEFDTYLYKAGRHYQLYKKLGAHVAGQHGECGTHFSVWAPNAKRVSVIGDFNHWDQERNIMLPAHDGSGIWTLFIPGVKEGTLYKYFVVANNGYAAAKGDPYAFRWETPPLTASVVHSLDYTWHDSQWLENRGVEDQLKKPLSIYELHLGSWKRVVTAEGERYMTYRELAGELPDYCRYMGFTHVEFMPVMEHPFYGSWGYQVTGYYAPTSRFGTPQDFMHLVDALHQAGIGVILDWVPSHFPTDEHGLGYFDGTHLYEYEDPRKGYHPDWKSNIFDYGRNEVKSFLISNALFWLDKYHADGLRVDAVASMLYLNYSRNDGEWIPNIYGGHEHLEAITFIKECNNAVHEYFPGVFTVAEESTAWPKVTHPIAEGGLGFDMKWMMGWMHDTLSYMQLQPVYRAYHHWQLTFSIVYAFAERFVLPLSHDEVVFLKKSLIDKMPGDEWQQFANLRLLYGYMFGHPGAKLLFMGDEFGQHHEWQHDHSLDWHEAIRPMHHGVQLLLRDLNHLYVSEAAMYVHNFTPDGFEWLDFNDVTDSVISWIRKGNTPREQLVFIANFTPVVRRNYRLGMPAMGYYKELLNSDAAAYGGSNVCNAGLETAPIPRHGRSHSLSLTLPPLAVIVLKHTKGYEKEFGLIE